ncbi:MAG: DUF932 domain-containing protein [bacterium]|nr:DUF932 domain-containing protein [bacterium]MDE2875402.1 DUF932 domain-containing protein [Gemmatimonadota bacterium]
MIYSAQAGCDAVMFPVAEVDVFAETEPGRLERVHGRKAIVNTDSRRVLSVVSERYRVLHNRDALELARRCCIKAFPTTAPVHWEVVEVEAPRTGSYCRIDLRHSGTVLQEDWAFDRGKTDLYEPFLRVTNSYNRTRVFSIRLGVLRCACANGELYYHDSLRIAVAHDTSRIEEVIEREITEAKFRKAMGELRRQRRKLLGIKIPPDRFRPIVLSVLGIRKPRGLPEDRERDWQRLMAIIDDVGKGYRESLGPNAYALFNTLTDLASRPPDPEGEPTGNGERSSSRSYGESERKGYTFIRRERHTLQTRTGTWLRWFAGQSGSRQFLWKYLPDPYYPTSADLRRQGF